MVILKANGVWILIARQITQFPNIRSTYNTKSINAQPPGKTKWQGITKLNILQPEISIIK
jgi:hypothetical protein